MLSFPGDAQPGINCATSVPPDYAASTQRVIHETPFSERKPYVEQMILFKKTILNGHGSGIESPTIFEVVPLATPCL